MTKKKNYSIIDSSTQIKPCINCNPKKYLIFNFSYISHESKCNQNDIIALWNRMRWMSQFSFYTMVHEYGNDKARWFENIPVKQIKKEVPSKFREDFPTETNEKYSVMRVYPAGRAQGSANPRIIGMMKHNIFYVFFLDWKGELYKHN